MDDNVVWLLTDNVDERVDVPPIETELFISKSFEYTLPLIDISPFKTIGPFILINPDTIILSDILIEPFKVSVPLIDKPLLP